MAIQYHCLLQIIPCFISEYFAIVFIHKYLGDKMLKILPILSVVMLLFAITPARADWCHKVGGGIELCDSAPATWSDCGQAKDGGTIWCYPQSGGKKKSSKNHDATKVILISVGVGAVFAGAMWYFFHKKPSENNPGQVTLMEF